MEVVLLVEVVRVVVEVVVVEVLLVEVVRVVVEVLRCKNEPRSIKLNIMKPSLCKDEYSQTLPFISGWKAFLGCFCSEFSELVLKIIGGFK